MHSGCAVFNLNVSAVQHLQSSRFSFGMNTPLLSDINVSGVNESYRVEKGVSSLVSELQIFTVGYLLIMIITMSVCISL